MGQTGQVADGEGDGFGGLAVAADLAHQRQFAAGAGVGFELHGFSANGRAMSTVAVALVLLAHLVLFADSFR
ncbi:hypothetical protein D3C76_654830 [compost metagenome]